MMTMMITMSTITSPPMAAPIMIVISFFLTGRVLSVEPEDSKYCKFGSIQHHGAHKSFLPCSPITNCVH